MSPGMMRLELHMLRKRLEALEKRRSTPADLLGSWVGRSDITDDDIEEAQRTILDKRLRG